MIRKYATIAGLACAAVISTYAVYASHLGYPSTHIIFGRAYFYTLNLYAIITKLTGRDIKDGTKLAAEVKILKSETLGFNPQTHQIAPGVGPVKKIGLISDPLSSLNLDKKDRTKSTFTTTATGDLVVVEEERLSSLFKSGQGNSQWYQIYWQDRSCVKGHPDPLQNTCYARFAWFDPTQNGKLVYVGTTTEVPPCVMSASELCPSGTYSNWTFVFLPGEFALKAVVLILDAPDQDTTLGDGFNWFCSFKLNPANDQPYSINNPPTGGWGGQVPDEGHYNCTPITLAQYNSYK